jgi:hypothetical protein
MKTKQLHHWRIVASSLSVLTGKASFVDCLISTHVRGVKLVTVEVEGVTQRDCSGTISGARRSICKLTISISGCSIVVGAGYIGVVCIYNINQTRRYNEVREFLSTVPIEDDVSTIICLGAMDNTDDDCGIQRAEDDR